MPANPPTTLGRRRLLAAAIALAAGPALGQAAWPERPSETLVKAAFLHKFASFVEWPAGSFAQPDAPLRIAVHGDDQLLEDLRELARDRPRDGRPVSVHRVGPSDPLAGYHVFYVRGSSRARTAELLQSVPEGLLTVTDTDGEHLRGSVISFFMEDGRVRFGASLEAATRQRLRLSSRLLSVARRVHGAGVEGGGVWLARIGGGRSA